MCGGGGGSGPFFICNPPQPFPPSPFSRTSSTHAPVVFGELFAGVGAAQMQEPSYELWSFRLQESSANPCKYTRAGASFTLIWHVQAGMDFMDVLRDTMATSKLSAKWHDNLYGRYSPVRPRPLLISAAPFATTDSPAGDQAQAGTSGGLRCVPWCLMPH